MMVQLTPEMFQKREIVTGPGDGLRTEVVSGLSEGERVIAEGAILVKLSQSSSVTNKSSVSPNETVVFIAV